MTTALNIAIWVSVVVCVIGIVVIACWLLLDWQREVQQARAASRMARDYCGVAGEAEVVKAAEYTWPIVAQQPQRFYTGAITVPIPRTVVDVVLPSPCVEYEEPVELHWPPVDVDRLVTSGAHLKTDVFPVIHDEWSNKVT